jgi:hypothetical protein
MQEIIDCPKCRNQTWFLVQDVTTHEREGYEPTKEVSMWYLQCSKCFEEKKLE